MIAIAVAKSEWIAQEQSRNRDPGSDPKKTDPLTNVDLPFQLAIKGVVVAFKKPFSRDSDLLPSPSNRPPKANECLKMFVRAVVIRRLTADPSSRIRLATEM